GRAADPANWRVAKSIFVAKDAATAKAYATDPTGPYVFYYRSLLTKLKTSGRIELFKTRRDQPDDEVTLEMICDKLIIHGTPESVADQLLAFSRRSWQVWYAVVCRQGLERSRAWTPIHDYDG